MCVVLVVPTAVDDEFAVEQHTVDVHHVTPFGDNLGIGDDRSIVFTNARRVCNHPVLGTQDDNCIAIVVDAVGFGTDFVDRLGSEVGAELSDGVHVDVDVTGIPVPEVRTVVERFADIRQCEWPRANGFERRPIDDTDFGRRVARDCPLPRNDVDWLSGEGHRGSCGASTEDEAGAAPEHDDKCTHYWFHPVAMRYTFDDMPISSGATALRLISVARVLPYPMRSQSA